MGAINEIVTFDLGNKWESCENINYIELLDEHELKALLAWRKAWCEFISIWRG